MKRNNINSKIESDDERDKKRQKNKGSLREILRSYTFPDKSVRLRSNLADKNIDNMIKFPSKDSIKLNQMYQKVDKQIEYSIADFLWHGCTFWKIPYHTVGNAKKRMLRIKHAKLNDKMKVRIRILSTSESSLSSNCVGDYEDAAYPLSLEWIDIVSKKQNPKSLCFEKMTSIQSGHKTQAFQAYIAKNGKDSVPSSQNCFSIVSSNRSIDLYIKGPVDLQKWIISLNNLMCQVQSSSTNCKSPRRLPRKQSIESYDGSKSKEEALLVSARSGDVDSFLWYLENGLHVDFMDERSGDTALIIACRLGKPDIVKAALDKGAKNDPHPTYGQTALQVAVSAGNVDCVRLILETAAPSGSDSIIVNHEDSNKEAPLHVSSRCGSQDILRLLVKHGADLRILDSQNRTCLHHVCQGGHVDCLKFILDNGGDILMEERDINGFTCLHASVKANRIECVQILYRAGADLNTVTMEGHDVYEVAQANKLTKMYRLLKSYEIVEDESKSFPRPYDLSTNVNKERDSKSGGKEENIFDGLEVYDLSVRVNDIKNIMPAKNSVNCEVPSQSSAKNLIYKARDSIRMKNTQSTNRTTYPVVHNANMSNTQTYNRYHTHSLHRSENAPSYGATEQLGPHYSNYAVMPHGTNYLSLVDQNNIGKINSQTDFETEPYNFHQQPRFSCGGENWLVLYHCGIPYYQRESDGQSQVCFTLSKSVELSQKGIIYWSQISRILFIICNLMIAFDFEVAGS